jgi:hypothetical protein
MTALLLTYRNIHMRRKIDTQDLKYTVRKRYLALCAGEGKKPSWSTFYHEVASRAYVMPIRIQRLALTRIDEDRTATAAELLAFAKVLKTSVDTLSAEASAAILQQPQIQTT